MSAGAVCGPVPQAASQARKKLRRDSLSSAQHGPCSVPSVLCREVWEKLGQSAWSSGG